MSKGKVVVGMSGGVDSSVAAYLLKDKGYEVIGVTMQMLDGAGADTAIADAKRVCEHLGITHYVLDFRNDFKENVINYFLTEYKCGRTPNPCIVCNRRIKWEALLDHCGQFGADFLATGHYARIDRLENGRFAVKNSITSKKDQTYALYKLTQNQLEKTLMPVGEYSKEEIREIAAKTALPVANKPDSQDICFIPDNDYGAFIEANANEVSVCGNFVDKNGKVLGTHKGITHYTVGQRKGLNLPMGHPVFVTAIRPDTNEVVIGDNEDVFADRLVAFDVNYMAVADFPDGYRTFAKIRYNHTGAWCTVKKLDGGRIECVFDEQVRAVTPGQAVVFYDGEFVAGGATILY